MPIYEYQCEKCGEVFEVFQKVSDPPPKSHSCGSRKVKRIMSQTSFVLKGSGWYITDYGRKDTGGGSGDKKHRDKEPSKSEAAAESSKSSEASKSSDASKQTSGKADSGPKGSAAA